MIKRSKLIFEKSRDGRRCVTYECRQEAPGDIPDQMLREKPARLPEIAEVDLVRHYMELSGKAHGVDNGFYPLGSCTMKYNPRIHEEAASMSGFQSVHPYQEEKTVQGCLELMYNLKTALCEITGMHDMTLQPAAGAHGEFTGMLMIKAYHESRGEQNRNVMLVPDSAHGTNPASAVMAGFEVRQIPSDAKGCVDIASLRGMVGQDTAGLMLTNPNTLGLFEENIAEIAGIVHGAGGLLYYDGANLNAIMGIVRPGDMGFDVIHLNLHKTFSTPHGGGGPGSGPVGCCKKLAPFLPAPVVVKKDIGYSLDFSSSQSIGRVKNYYGNFSVLVKAYAYILSLGAQGLADVSKNAVLNANYMLSKLKGSFDVPYDRPCMHEFVLSAKSIRQKHGVSALDLSKGMLDYGMHPPTMYFPLIVEEALMVEPTETESIETLDAACAIMIGLAQKAGQDPDSLHNAPFTTPVSRLDEVAAARKPVVRYVFEEQQNDERAF